MAKNKKDLAKMIKKISRESQLEREKLVGRPRAKTFGGKPNPKELRRIEKRKLQGLDGDGD